MTTEKWAQILVGLVLLLGTSTSVFSNDTLVGESAHTIFPINTDKIQMISEDITIKMGPSGPGPFDRRALVSCSFIFDNKSDQDITAKVGFPGVEGNGRLAVYKLELDDFVVNVNGERTSVEKKKETLESKIKFTRGDEKIDVFRFWYTWDATFPARERTQIENSYRVYLSSDQFVWYFEYILLTGSNWLGPIKKAEIKLYYPDSADLAKRVLFVRPKGYVIKDNIIEWSFRDLKPTENVVLVEKVLWKEKNLKNNIIDEALTLRGYKGALRQYTDEDMQIHNLEGLTWLDRYQNKFSSPESLPFISNIRRYMRNLTAAEMLTSYIYTKDKFLTEMNRLYAKLLRNEIYARHGRVFNTIDIKEFFEATNWYKPNPDFSTDHLSPMEEDNIEFIVNYEKKHGWR